MTAGVRGVEPAIETEEVGFVPTIDDGHLSVQVWRVPGEEPCVVLVVDEVVASLDEEAASRLGDQVIEAARRARL